MCSKHKIVRWILALYSCIIVLRCGEMRVCCSEKSFKRDESLPGIRIFKQNESNTIYLFQIKHHNCFQAIC